MKFFHSDQIREIDAFTIRNEPVTSVDLMERAAMQLFNWITGRFDRTVRFVIFTGPGNNGGDGLALARLLSSNRYDCELHYVKFSRNESDDWKHNRERLLKETDVKFYILDEADKFPLIDVNDVIIDALFGSGLTRPAEGLPAGIIRQINQTSAVVVSVDIPSGLSGEANSGKTEDNIIKADYTLSFQFPRLSFMFAENAVYTGEWIILPIGLSPEAVMNTSSPWELTVKDDVLPLLKRRNRFDHKGIFGHALFIAGSMGKMGAAVLGAGAAMRTGVGLLTCHIPSSGVQILQTVVPEAMVSPDNNVEIITGITGTDRFDAVGIGPGIGTDPLSAAVLHSLLVKCNKPMVIDADALNILGMNREWLSRIPGGAILTPHPREFERIAGSSPDSYHRLLRQMEFSKRFRCIVVLKGANTSVTTPDGKVHFNTTGNPGMATAGSGDVLTGILLSLLAQGYPPEDAAVTGVFLHGLAGDITAKAKGFEALIASDLTENIGNAYKWLREEDPGSEVQMNDSNK